MPEERDENKVGFNRKIIATLAILILCFTSVYVARFFVGYTSAVTSLERASIKSKGNPHASLKIIEYIDYECEACAQGSKLLHDFIEQFPSRVFIKVKHFPLIESHRHALKGAQYAECAAREGKFWEYHELLLEEQSFWRTMDNPKELFAELALDVGMERSEVEACVGSNEIRIAVLAERAEGESMGVASTPTYFINGKMIVGPKSLQKELQKLLKGEKN